MPQPGDVAEAVGAESFWRFSLALYARPGVMRALLTLQDRDGLDVNLILFGLWLGAVRGVYLTESALQGAVAALDSVRRSAILPLRELRRALKQGPLPELRARVAVAELAAERMAQARLALLAAALPRGIEERGSAAEANLAACLGRHIDGPEAAIIRQELASLRRQG